MAGTNFTKLTETEAATASQDSATGQSKVSSSSKLEEEKENDQENNISSNHEEGKSRVGTENGGGEDECVPDSSNTANEDDVNQEEQHSSGSVDEELLEDDDAKGSESEGPVQLENNEESQNEKSDQATQNSLVGELMNKFGFSDILEYQEAYRKAVEESKDQLHEGLSEGENNNESSGNKSMMSGLKLRNDIIDSEPRIKSFSKTEFMRNFETLKRLRPDLRGHGSERESLFAGYS